MVTRTYLSVLIYIIIIELDVRTAIDPREFVEIPSVLFLTLSYAFWLSFGRLGAVSPTTWPLGEVICFCGTIESS